MKIGYPCINYSIGKKTISTFRLSSYSEEKLIQSIKYNLNTLLEILNYNIDHNLMFFRISSDIVPFASHPLCTFNWQDLFRTDFKKIGEFILKNNLRISMHPDQFVIINAKDKNIVERSIGELEYHREILDLMNLDNSAKIQIHIGGVYGEKELSKKRFISNFDLLSDRLKKRLVIENDDHLYHLNDCLEIHDELGIPVLFDTFHHECFGDDLDLIEAIKKVDHTWNHSKDGIMMIDYSNQEKDKRKGKHSKTLLLKNFLEFIRLCSFTDFDIMLEVKDKEQSAKKARKLLDQINNDSTMFKNKIFYYKES
ncbi:MAG: UV DNA damage repair endonuclease UvsE [Nitrososphaeraceae archaeon]|nr:UV DNA damage repair endonuclease UvsE [Nitrososphaeraceae archaeon]